MNPEPKFEQEFRAIRAAAKVLRRTPGSEKNKVLLTLAGLLQERLATVLEANAADVAALPADRPPAFRDRLLLTEDRVYQMIDALTQIAALPDPVGEETDKRTLRSGLRARLVRSPLGVILMIFESRPNVALEAFALAFKSGNVILLRGGKESMKTTAVIYDLLAEALQKCSMSVDSFHGIRDSNRELLRELLRRHDQIDVVIPRGGASLIQFVTDHSKIPIIKNDRGLCHIYVHDDADLSMAIDIAVNAKIQRPGVCNAMETLLIHETMASRILPVAYERMLDVEWHCDPRSLAILGERKRLHPAQPDSWDTEYLSLQVNCRVVSNLTEAIRHIDDHGTGHSEAIVTSSAVAAQEFQAEVDAAVVYWNASTRFTDGFEMGLGAEIGISTQKLHVRGPVGLRELTCARWIIDGEGQVRK